MARAPLNEMRFRTQELASALQATYGTKEQVARHKNGVLAGHQGWDLAALDGTPCYAVEDGIIVDVGHHPDFGNYINLQFSRNNPSTTTSRADDTYFAFYAHLSRSVVVTGSIVRAGDRIGYTGHTGIASGNAPHLHFEIHTVSTSSPGKGLVGRVDPGEILGYQYYQSIPSIRHRHHVSPHHPVHRGVHHHRHSQGRLSPKP